MSATDSRAGLACSSGRRRISVCGNVDPAAGGRLPCDDRHDDTGRLRQCRARCRGDLGHSARGSAGVGRSSIGAEYVCLEFRDLAIFNDDESRRRVTEALRRIQPEIILTAPPADYIADHEMTSLLVRDACFAAPCPNYTTRQWEPAPPLAEDPAPLLRRSGRGRRPRRAAGAGRFPRGRLAGVSRPSARCSPVTPASATGCLRQHGIDEYLEMQAKWGARRGGRDRRRVAPRRSASIAGHPYPQDNLLLQTARAGRPGQAGRTAGPR